MASASPPAIRSTEERSEAKRPTVDNLSGNIVQFLEELQPGPVLPFLFQSGVIDQDEYYLFREKEKREKRPEIVDELIKLIIKNDTRGSENIQKLHKALLKAGFTKLADSLCTPSFAGERERPHRWTFVNLKDLTEEPRYDLSMKVQILHRRSWTNTTAEFVVGEKDDAKHLLVYLQSFDTKLQQYAIGSSLLLCDAAWVPGHLVVSSRNVSRTSSVTVSEEGRSEAGRLNSQPSPEPAPSGSPLSEVLEAPLGTLLFTTVTIGAVEQVKMIKVKPETVPRKDFRIRDDSGEMPAELWRIMAAIEIAPGQKWRFLGKVVENIQHEKGFRVLRADCVDATTSAPDLNWLSSDNHQEGELQSFEVKHYVHCSTEECSNKKIIPGTPCNTCGRSSCMKAIYAKMKLLLDGDTVALAAFSPELSQLYAPLGLDFDESLPESELEDQIIEKMPFVCGVKFDDDNVVSNIRMK